jgi:hypothetical protein
MPDACCPAQRFLHQGAADALRTAGFGNCERAKQQGRDAARPDMPQAQCANEARAILRRKREAFRGLTACTQALYGLFESCCAKGFIEQALAREGIAGRFQANGDILDNCFVSPQNWCAGFEI